MRNLVRRIQQHRRRLKLFWKKLKRKIARGRNDTCRVQRSEATRAEMNEEIKATMENVMNECEREISDQFVSPGRWNGLRGDNESR